MVSYRYFLKNSTLALKAPSFPAFTFGLLCVLISCCSSLSYAESTYHVALDRESMVTSFPVRTLVAWGELASAKDLIRQGLLFLRERCIDLAAVD